MINKCLFSNCRKYRYVLEHTWNDDSLKIVWIALNPSSADEQQLDPTLRRIKGFSESWGYGGFIMLNLFAFRATLPKDMISAEDPIGPQNNEILDQYSSFPMVAAWGKDGKFKNRDKEVIDLIGKDNLYYLKLNKDNSPAHPLYLKKDLMLKKYE